MTQPGPLGKFNILNPQHVKNLGNLLEMQILTFQPHLPIQISLWRSSSIWHAFQVILKHSEAWKHWFGSIGFMAHGPGNKSKESPTTGRQGEMEGDSKK